MRRRVVLVPVTLVVVAALVAVGLLARGGHRGADSAGSESRPSPTASFVTTPLSAYDATGVSVTRGAFCAGIDPRQVTAALGNPATSQRSWGDGDRARLGGGPRDVSHEYGCEFDGAADGVANGAIARAWVFAPPVRTSTATRLAAQHGGRGSCTSSPASFGSPGSLLVCRTGKLQSATYRGLFGDAWLSCELDVPLATPAAEVLDRAGRWCVGVLAATSSRS